MPSGRPKIVLMPPENPEGLGVATQEATSGLVVGIVGVGHDCTAIRDLIESNMGNAVEVLVFDTPLDLEQYKETHELDSNVHDYLHQIKLTQPKRIRDFPQVCEREPIKQKHYHNSPVIKRKDFKKKR